VAVSALLAWWAASGAGQPPTTRYVVVVGEVGPGEVIEASDLALAVADLPIEVKKVAFTDATTVAGRVALGPLIPGSLVTSGSVSDRDPAHGERELTFPVISGWALDGDLRVGDRIDVFATYGDGVTSQTMRVLAGATVRRISANDGARLGEGSGPTLTVGIGPDVALERVVNATRAAEVTVARVTSTNKPRTDPTAGQDRYRAATDLAGPGTDAAVTSADATSIPPGTSDGGGR
jgi:hypothetical protein